MSQILNWRPPEIPVAHPEVFITPRQADVLTGMCLGLTNFQIGRRLHLSEATVKTHAKRLLQALGVRTRGHAVALTRSGQVAVYVQMGPS